MSDEPLLSSAGSTALPVTYAFGPFTLSTQDRLLKRNGEIVSLPPKVVDTLLVLVTANGELVTKEHLLDAVWGSTFVDPNSISQNILRLRKTLDPDLPDAIATVPKRGYRFTSVITTTNPSATPPPTATPTPTHTPPAPLLTPLQPASSARRLPFLLVLALILIAIVSIGLHWRGRKQALADTHRPAIAILGFDDLSGTDPDSKSAWIGTALSETLYSELAADPNLRMVPNGAVETMRKDLTLGRTTTLPPETLTEICNDLHCDLLVVGRYLVSDGHIRVDIALQDARTGETITTFHHTDTTERLLPIIAASGQALRTKLGMTSLTEAEQNALLADEAKNPDALHAYASGMVRLRALDAAAARPFFEQAIQLEPDYPLAHSGLSTALAMLGLDADAATEAGKALDLSGNLSHAVKLELEAQYATLSSRWDKAVADDRTLVKEFPDDLRYGLALANTLTSAGKPRDALTVIAELRKLPEPSRSDPRLSLAEASAYEALNDFARALPAAQSADKAARAAHQQSVLTEALLDEGDALDRTGQPQQARTRFAEARDLASSEQDSEAVITALRKDAVSARETGDLASSRTDLTQALTLARKLGDRKSTGAAATSLAQLSATAHP